MRKQETSISSFRERVRRKQQEASALTIELGMGALDSTDPDALSETIRCLEAAIDALEPARPRPTTDVQELMEDLGHSLAPLDFSVPTYRRLPRPSHRRRNGNRVLQFASLHEEPDADSLRFFE